MVLLRMSGNLNKLKLLPALLFYFTPKSLIFLNLPFIKDNSFQKCPATQVYPDNPLAISAMKY